MAHDLHNLLFLLGESPETSAAPIALQAETFRAHDIETFDTVACRVHTAGAAEVLFVASHTTAETVDPTFIIVDGNGLIRGEYPYSSISSDADRLSRHIGILGEEILFAKGNNRLVYEAAHIFLCYP